MDFSDSEFSAVLDKGTLDALMPDASVENVTVVIRMFQEIQRVLRFGGRFVCISLLQPHLLKTVLEHFHAADWMIRIHRSLEAESKEIERSFSFPVFVVICTKMKAFPSLKPLLEYCGSEDSQVERMPSIDSVLERVSGDQQYAFLSHKIQSTNISTEQITIDFYGRDPSNQDPRYTVHLVDDFKNQNASLKYGVFIVPQGRETEWLFGSEEGRICLCQQSNCKRLLVVQLNPNHIYDNLEQVKGQLSERVMDFAPKKYQKKVPFLSLGEDIGKRKVIHRGESPSTGGYVVEDVEVDGETFRKLIFTSNRNVVQSEAKLRVCRGFKSKREEPQVDHGHLACAHHAIMIGGLALLPFNQIKDGVDVLLIGLGGGGLPSFIQKFIPKVFLDVVEIDPTILNIAERFFQLEMNERLRVHLEDGLAFIRSSPKERYDLIMLDVDSKDSSKGLSVPPRQFMEGTFLTALKGTLKSQGLLVLNLVCRNQNLKQELFSEMFNVFLHFWEVVVPGEVNSVVFAFADSRDGLPQGLPANLKGLNRLLEKGTKMKEVVSVSENNFKKIQADFCV